MSNRWYFCASYIYYELLDYDNGWMMKAIMSKLEKIHSCNLERLNFLVADTLIHMLNGNVYIAILIPNDQ